ncbi:MAG: hypothetical protein HYU33_00900 [Candidatus Omnitrophica bacterium]|nr:hypothetical protein [Candidatus Omnitrophota bacterium]MBI3009481.1 hypothetical protein [Candidatus Omnitrophota bacterium]
MRRGSGNAPLIELATKNISLAGVYVEAEEGQVPAVNEIVVTTISIPEEERRAFPFARLVGRSRVVRVKPLPSSQNTSSKKRYGIALEFGSDMTALSGIPPRG